MKKNGWMQVSMEQPYCSECKGKCWDEKNNTQTIKNAREMFGVVPNKCVNGSLGFGDVHCPYALLKSRK